MTRLDVLTDFFDGYRAFVGERGDVRLAEVSRFIERLKSDLPALQDKIRKEERLDAPRFNVFQALGIERKEELLHTQLLAHLLSPEATHGQGFLFLRHFFAVVQKEKAFITPTEPIDAFRWRIRSEVSVGDGNILDLVIECPQLRYIVVVENKIDAGEGKKQLERYNRWLLIHRQGYTRLLVFLTLDGRQPTSSGDSECNCISYCEHIRDFLRASLNEAAAHPIREIVRQYLVVVENLIGDSEDEQQKR